MTRSEVRWLVAVTIEDGSLEPFRLQPLGAALEFTARDRPAAERALLAMGLALPDAARLVARVEFEAIRRMPLPPRKQPRRRSVLVEPLPASELEDGP